MSPVVEELAAEEEVDLDVDEVNVEDLDMDNVKEEYLDMDKVDVEEAAKQAAVAVANVVEAVEEEAIIIVTKTMEGRIKIMELIHRILRGNLHLNNSQL